MMTITAYHCQQCGKNHRVSSALGRRHRPYAHPLPPGCKWPDAPATNAPEVTA